MRELTLVGAVCAAFALGAYRGTGSLGVFGLANLVVAAVCLALSAALFLRRWDSGRTVGAAGGTLFDSVLRCVAVLWAAALLQQAASVSGVRFDWTYEGRYQLSEATIALLGRLDTRLIATLYADVEDPRIRRSQLLLDEMASRGDVAVRTRMLGDVPEEEDYFAIRSSNTVVFELRDRWERVDRPTEGAMFEAISYLAVSDRSVMYATAGAGEGDFTKTGAAGFSGLAAALETEGMELRVIDAAVIGEIPRDADGVILIAPERRLHPAMLDALGRYLERGGSLVAMLEPGRTSGLEELLGEFGLRSPDAVVVDPASDSVDGRREGLNPIAFNYAETEITKGLDRNRRTYFKGSRSFRLRKPKPDDKLRAAVFASGDSWLFPAADLAGDGRPVARPADARSEYHPLVVTGVYRRGTEAGDGKTPTAETRIVAFGDSNFADNANLRSLYNLDLAMNAVHWALRRDPQIQIRPKAGQLIQFPLPIQSSLKAFYGVGLLVPQLLLIAGGLVWLRRRTA